MLLKVYPQDLVNMWELTILVKTILSGILKTLNINWGLYLRPRGYIPRYIPQTIENR